MNRYVCQKCPHELSINYCEDGDEITCKTFYFTCVNHFTGQAIFDIELNGDVVKQMFDEINKNGFSNIMKLQIFSDIQPDIRCPFYCEHIVMQGGEG
jgi:hypothetical protein